MRPFYPLGAESPYGRSSGPRFPPEARGISICNSCLGYDRWYGPVGGVAPYLDVPLPPFFKKKIPESLDTFTSQA